MKIVRAQRRSRPFDLASAPTGRRRRAPGLHLELYGCAGHSRIARGHRHRVFAGILWHNAFKQKRRAGGADDRNAVVTPLVTERAAATGDCDSEGDIIQQSRSKFGRAVDRRGEYFRDTGDTLAPLPVYFSEKSAREQASIRVDSQ